MSPDAQHADSVSEKTYPFQPCDGLELHPLYRHLRTHEPLCPVRMPHGEPALLVTRYEDVKTVLGDTRFGREIPPGHDQPRTTPEVIPMGLMELDPPDHTRVRRLIASAFTPRRAERQRPATERLAISLLDRMAATGPPADLVGDFAVPLSLGVICDLLGIPVEDRDDFRRWVVAMNDALAGSSGDEQRMESIATLATYVAELVVQRRGEPTDDLIGELVRARDEDEHLEEGELIFLCMLLLVAGYETTASQIGNFVHLLATHPGQLALLKERPELLPNAVEELLRFTPLTVSAAYPRFARSEVELSDGSVGAGTPVLTSTSAANRDPRVFDDPERLDITRPAGHHLGFGHGAHHCVGAALARMELQVALGLLLERLPGVRLAAEPDTMTWKSSLLFRGHTELPVTW